MNSIFKLKNVDLKLGKEYNDKNSQPSFRKIDSSKKSSRKHSEHINLIDSNLTNEDAFGKYLVGGSLNITGLKPKPN